MDNIKQYEGSMDDVMSALGVCHEARKVYQQAQGPYKGALKGWTPTMKANLLLATVEVEAAFGRLLRHKSYESRRRCLDRIWDSADWRTMSTLIELAQARAAAGIAA